MSNSNGRVSTGKVLDADLRTVAEQIIAKYPNKRSAALPLLFLVQSVEGHVTEAGMKEVAELLGITSAEVLGTGSFYTMLKKKPTGEYLVSVCRNISCTHLGARRVLAAIEAHLGISTGETTPDGKVTLESAECLATCDGAPSMQINYEDFYRITSGSVIDLIDRLRAEQEVRGMRGDPVKSHKEISYEFATAGLRKPAGPPDRGRTVGGESPRADTAPGFRPKETGSHSGGGG